MPRPARRRFGSAAEAELEAATPTEQNASKCRWHAIRSSPSCGTWEQAGLGVAVVGQREIGADRERREGPAKVTGTAPYAAEHPFADPAYAHPVQAAIARGTITAIATEAASAVRGVLAVLTHENAERLASDEDKEFWLLQSPEVCFRGQFVAGVVAESAEAAREAAELVEVSYKEQDHDVVLRSDHPDLYAPEQVNPSFPTDTEDGDVEAGLASAAARVDATYTTPANHNNPMEPHTTVARWDPAPEHLTLHDSTQSVHGVRELIAPLFGLKVEQVSVIAPHIGGGFGSKGTPHAHDVLACLAARAVPGRDVKLALTRQMLFSVAGYRTPTVQRMRLGADADGRLLALVHDAWEQTSRIKEFAEQTAVSSRGMYASRSRRTTHRLAPLDVPVPSWMRAPRRKPRDVCRRVRDRRAGDRPRHRPDRAAYPQRARSGPGFRQALLEPQPRSLPPPGRRALRLARARSHAVAQARAGRPRLAGTGVAASTYPVHRLPGSEAAIDVRPDGRYRVRIGAVDIGTGTWTALAQVAADALAVSLEQIELEIGDTSLPHASVAGGSSGITTWGSAVSEALAT